ncbi:putative membrane spanning protein [Giardia duodenalis assemblage B]|uniref:Putative membrane spanning protein n=1 Tax=Giardia duodenalis assemblage B TaxID=1394984 RepID=A0A132NQA1_GIAIN|nr:putative membrane spanning protein [Giardia intestinalis assemblage B]
MSMSQGASVFSDQPSDLPAILRKNDMSAEHSKISVFYDSLRLREGCHSSSAQREVYILFNSWIGISKPPPLFPPSSNFSRPFECNVLSDSVPHSPLSSTMTSDFSTPACTSSSARYCELSYLDSLNESSQSASMSTDFHSKDVTFTGPTLIQPLTRNTLTRTNVSGLPSLPGLSDVQTLKTIPSEPAPAITSIQSAPVLNTWTVRSRSEVANGVSQTGTANPSQGDSQTTSSSGTRRQKTTELTNAETGMQVVVIKPAVKSRTKKQRKSNAQSKNDNEQAYVNPEDAPRRVVQSSSDTTQIFLPAIVTSNVQSYTESKSDPRTVIGLTFGSENNRCEGDFGPSLQKSNSTSASPDTSPLSAFADDVKPPVFNNLLNEALLDPRELEANYLISKSDAIFDMGGDGAYSATDPAHLLGSPQNRTEIISDFSSTEVTYETPPSDRHLKWRKSATKDAVLLQHTQRTLLSSSERRDYTYQGHTNVSSHGNCFMTDFDILQPYSVTRIEEVLQQGSANKGFLGMLFSTSCETMLMISSWVATVLFTVSYFLAVGTLFAINRSSSFMLMSFRDPFRILLPFVVVVFIKRLLFIIPFISHYMVKWFYPSTIDEALLANGSYYGEGKVPDKRLLPTYLSLDKSYKDFFPPIFVHSSKKKTGFLEYLKAVMGSISVSDVLHNMLDQTFQLRLYGLYGQPKLRHDVGLSSSLSMATQDYFEVPLNSYKLFHDTPNGRLPHSGKQQLIRYFNSYLPIQEHHIKPMTFTSEYTLVGNDHLTENEYRRASLKMYDIGERFRQPEGKDYQDIYSSYGLLADPHSIYERPGDDIRSKNYRYRRIMAGEYLVVVSGAVSDSFSPKSTSADEAAIRKWLTYGFVLFGRSSVYGPFMAKDTHYIVNRRIINNDHTTLTVSDNTGNIIRITLEDPNFTLYCRSLTPRHLWTPKNANARGDSDHVQGTFENCNFNDLVIYYDHPFEFTEKPAFVTFDTFETLDARAAPIAERKIKGEERLLTEDLRITLIDPTFPRLSKVNNSATLITINPKVHINILFRSSKVPLDRVVECTGRDCSNKLLTASEYLQYFRPVSDDYLNYLSIKPLVAPAPVTPNSLWPFTDTQLAYFYKELTFSKAQVAKKLESCRTKTRSGHRNPDEAYSGTGISSLLQPTKHSRHRCSHSYVADLQNNLRVIDLQIQDVVASQQGYTVLTCLSNRSMSELKTTTRNLRTMECTFLFQRIVISLFCSWIISCAIQTHARILYGLLYRVQKDTSFKDKSNTYKGIALSSYTMRFISLCSGILRLIDTSKKGAHRHNITEIIKYLFVQAAKSVITFYPMYLSYSNAPKLLAALYLSNLQYRLILAYVFVLVLSGQFFAHFGLYNPANGHFSYRLIKNFSEKVSALTLTITKNTGFRSFSLLLLRLLNTELLLIAPTILWLFTSVIFRLMYHLSIEGIYGGEERFSHSLYRVTFSTFDFVIHPSLYSFSLCVLLLSLFLLLSCNTFVANWKLSYSLRQTPYYISLDQRLPVSYLASDSTQKSFPLLDEDYPQLADEIRRIYPDLFTTRLGVQPKRKGIHPVRRHSPTSSNTTIVSDGDTFYFRPIEDITPIYCLEELGPWSPKIYLYGNMMYKRLFSVPGFYGSLVATTIWVSPHEPYASGTSPSSDAPYAFVSSVFQDVNSLLTQSPQSYLQDSRRIPTVIYDQPTMFPVKHQLQNILRTRASLFVRTTKRMVKAVRMQCATLPWSVFLPTYEFKISKFVFPSQMLHALVCHNAAGQLIDPVMSLGLFFSGITLPSSLLQQMVPLQYTFTTSPDSILKLRKSTGHRLVRRLLTPISEYMMINNSLHSLPSFHLNIIDRPVRNVVSNGAGQVETAKFLLHGEEVSRAIQLGNSLLGGLKEVLTVDQGEQLKNLSAPLGAIVRDDMIPRLTPQELLLMLSVSFLDYFTVGHLHQSPDSITRDFLLHCPRTMTRAKDSNRHREHSGTTDSLGNHTLSSRDNIYSNYFRHELVCLRSDYSRLLQYICQKNVSDCGYLPLDFSAYRLVSILGRLPLFNQGVVPSLASLFNFDRCDLLGWIDKVLEKVIPRQELHSCCATFASIVFEAAPRNIKFFGLTKKTVASFLDKLVQPEEYVDTELERIMFTEDKDLDKTSLESIDFIISRIYLRILELSVLSIVSRAISTMYHFVLQASGYSTFSLEHFKDELKHGELYTSFFTALPSSVRQLYNEEHSLFCSTCNKELLEIFRSSGAHKLVADYAVQNQLCSSCFASYYANIMYPLASYENDITLYLFNQIAKQLTKAWCCEDVLSLLYHAGFVSDEYFLKQLCQEASTFIKQAPPSAYEITTTGCVVMSFGEISEKTRILRLHKVSEALLSVSLQLQRMHHICTFKQPTHRNCVSCATYCESRSYVEDSQHLALLYIILTSEKEYAGTKDVFLYSSTHTSLGRACKQGLRTDWHYALIQNCNKF